MSARSSRTASTASGGSASTYVIVTPGWCSARSVSRRGTTVGDADGKRDEPHAPGAQTAQLGEFAGRGIQRRRHRRSVTSQHAAGFGEAHAAADPLDHRHAQPLLEPLHLLAERRLAVAEGCRGRGDRALVGDRLDHAQRLHVELGIIEDAVSHGSKHKQRA